MRKVQFGCGGYKPEGWENYDIEVDITKPLPFDNNSIDLIFLEHVLEHLDSREGYLFLEEAHRILIPGGLIKIIVPYPPRVSMLITEEYKQFYKSRGWSNPIKSLMTEHGHKSMWNSDLISTVFSNIGFDYLSDYIKEHEKKIKLFNGIGGHGKSIGEENNYIESISFIGEKI